MRGFGGGGARRHSNRTKDLDNVTQKVVIKQAQPGRLKAGSSARDAPSETGRDHRDHHAGNRPHSVRGFLTAVVRTKLGLTLVSEKTGEERVYRIVANDVSPKRKGRPGRKAA